MMSSSHGPTVAILLSGGAGTRLWPMSRPECPKQFLKLFGDRHSLYQLTLMRLHDCGVDHIIVAANKDHEALLREQAAEIGGQSPHIIFEPARRDSGLAIAAAVATARKLYGDDITVGAFPCDHLIPDTRAFDKTLRSAIVLAGLGYLATFGIMPTSPSPEFGYLQRGEPIAGHPDGYRVVKFHEKPKPELAARYLAEGSYAWNSGMFVFTAKTFAAEAEAAMPELWTAALKATELAVTREGASFLDGPTFLAAPKISIDYALFEKSDRVAMVPAQFAWSDVGNWSAVFGLMDQDDAGNATSGDVGLRDCRDSLIIADDSRIIGIGLTDMLVVARPEGVFVAPRSRATEVKDLLERKG